MDSGIYSITSPSGKRYIGSSSDIPRRWRTHRRELRDGAHHCEALQRAFNKYGASGLIFAVLEFCDPASLFVREQAYVDAVARAQLYNAAPIAGSVLGIKRSAETRAKMSAAARNRSAETRTKLADAIRGRKHSVEARMRMSVAVLGRKHSEETRAKMSIATRGISDARRAQMAVTARELGDEHRAKMIVGRRAVARVKAAAEGRVVGVRAFRAGKWQAQVSSGGEVRHVGTFGSQTLAHAMRLLYLEAWPYREHS